MNAVKIHLFDQNPNEYEKKQQKNETKTNNM